MPSISSSYPNLKRAVLRVRIVLNLLGVLLFTMLLAGMDCWRRLEHTMTRAAIDLVLLVALAFFLLRALQRAIEHRRLSRAIAGEPHLSDVAGTFCFRRLMLARRHSLFSHSTR